MRSWSIRSPVAGCQRRGKGHALARTTPSHTVTVPSPAHSYYTIVVLLSFIDQIPVN